MADSPSPRLQSAFDSVAEADGPIAVTPIFSATFSGLFKLFFDCLDDTALAEKPVLIAATGGTGRHSLVPEHALRPVFTYLHSVVMPTAVSRRPRTGAAAAVLMGRSRNESRRRRGKFANEAYRSEPPGRPVPYHDPMPFERLLGGR
ncbi:NAD(P)H-dependent oxidoreductase [Streptomyces sp. NPDC058440]|uniref:NAD(P)H-dependent oxidoreductase n=1 Tax=Streptomyces sp. NPDC058440 TaxID=3346501 RepID=UPI00365C3001